MPWPPTFDEVKEDLDPLALDDEVDDAAVRRRLDATIAFVQRRRIDAFRVDDLGRLIEPAQLNDQGRLEEPSLVLGAIMMARRLVARRRSDDVVLWMAETGTTRVPFQDRDISRLLRLSQPRVG